MGFRQLYIKTAKHLKLNNGNIEIIKEDDNITLPLEDINTIFLEDPNTTITSRLLSSLSEYGISMIICNHTYLPSTHILPYNKHYLQSKHLKLQINSSNIFNNNLWKKIISSKILNQSKVIEYTTNDENTIKSLINYIKNIKVGDKDNKEAISARIFFSNLYGNDFIRFGSSSISSALNYGYSILHGCVVRNLSYLGINTNLGIWHESETNAYNLASDLIEPFRPIIDYYVFWNQDKIFNPLSKDIRMDFINILNNTILFDNKECTIEYSINKMCCSYINALENNNFELIKLPTIIQQKFLNG